MTERPDFSTMFDKQGKALVAESAPKSHEALIQEIESAGTPAAPAATTVDTKPAKIVRENWGNPNQEIAPAGEEIVAGIGVGASLVSKMEGMPGGFETNYASMLESLVDAGDACADPKAVVAAWDAAPGSLQTKICNDFLMYPRADNDSRYRRVMGKATLDEAAALGRLMRNGRK